MEKSLLIQYLGDMPKLRIIDFFLEKQERLLQKEIIENVGISKTTFYKVWDELMQFGIVKPTRKYGMAQLYTMDEKNPIIKKFMARDAELDKQAMKRATEEELTISR